MQNFVAGEDLPSVPLFHEQLKRAHSRCRLTSPVLTRLFLPMPNGNQTASGAAAEKAALIYQSFPVVTFATNKFINVPTILQFEDTPLLEVAHVADAGYTTRFQIYHEDGTYLAKVIGTQIYPTEAGSKAGLTLRHPDKMTVCEMNGKTLFEIKREGAAALKAAAELYAPNGAFIKCSDAGVAGRIITGKNAPLRIGNIVITDNTIKDYKIGIRVHRDGRIGIGVNP